MSPTTVEMLVQGARRGTRSAPRHDALPLSVDRMASLRQPLPTLSNRSAGVDEATERRAAVLDRHRREAHGPRQHVWIGAESGSQNILDAMDKGIALAQITQATKLLKAKGVKVGFFLQFGYLDETATDIQATLDLVATLQPDHIGVSISYPLPGTGFYEKIKHQLGAKQNWADSDDLDLMYKGQFSSAFYKNLHRYVHKSFRLKQHTTTLAAAGW